MSESLLGKVIAATESLTQTVEQQTSKINQAVTAATTVVRDTIRGYNFETYYIDPEAGNDENSGKQSYLPLKTFAALNNKLVSGKSYNINLPAGSRIEMDDNLMCSNVIYAFRSSYDNPATIEMVSVDYLGKNDGTVQFGGHNITLKLFGVILETAKLKPDSTNRSNGYRSSAIMNYDNAPYFTLEMIFGGIVINDFPFFRSNNGSAGFVALSLGHNSFIKLKGSESYFASSNDHYGLSYGNSGSFIENDHGQNTWKGILHNAGGNSNVLADFDFDAQV